MSTSLAAQLLSADPINFVALGRERQTGERAIETLPGQYFDAETGLHQNWFRDYDPSTGRYLQADPLGLVAGVSLYGYSLGNPITWFDPTGLETSVEPPSFLRHLFGPVLDYLFKCKRLERELEAAWKKCEESKACQPPPPKPDGSRDLEKFIVFTHGTGDPNEPIRRCVQRDNPGLVSETAIECGLSVIPGPMSVVPKEVKRGF